MADRITDEGFANLPANIAAESYREVVASGDKDRASVLHQIYYERHRVRLSDPTQVHEATMDAKASSATSAVALATPAYAAPSAASSGGSGGSAFGWIVFAIGLVLALGSFVFDPSISTSSDGIGALSIPSRIVNNGLLNIQLMMCVFGSALVITGSLFITRARG